MDMGAGSMKLTLIATIEKPTGDWRDQYDEVSHISTDGLFGVMLNHKYGFVNREGKEVVPPKYDRAWLFVEGLAQVEMNKRFGFIDVTGKEVIPIGKFDDAGNFSEGLALVRHNDKTGFMDKKGKLVVPLKYDYACDFKEGLARVRLNNKWGFVNKKGVEVIPLQYTHVKDFQKGLAEIKHRGKNVIYINQKNEKFVGPLKIKPLIPDWIIEAYRDIETEKSGQYWPKS